VKGQALRRIVIGYDGSDGARRALERAAGCASSDGTTLVVTAAPLLYPTRRAGDIVDPPESKEAQRVLKEARDELGRRGVPARTHEAAGDAGDAIIEVARESNADLVVVGTRGRNTAARVLLGSVSSKVVQGAPCDVLVVR
jgi:nucleotide-binding universal stress UspA family protein